MTLDSSSSTLDRSSSPKRFFFVVFSPLKQPYDEASKIGALQFLNALSIGKLEKLDLVPRSSASCLILEGFSSLIRLLLSHLHIQISYKNWITKKNMGRGLEEEENIEWKTLRSEE
ncbi:unnamed protein product [Citrullus colocynthis]|uniref:Uncharacterized protein n=1 Tax=Citrullus colocynthis TaxID=252529 RepID=A0ABP0XS67_9ROSI